MSNHLLRALFNVVDEIGGFLLIVAGIGLIGLIVALASGYAAPIVDRIASRRARKRRRTPVTGRHRAAA